MGGIVDGRMFDFVSYCLVLATGAFVGFQVAHVLFRRGVYPEIRRQETVEQTRDRCGWNVQVQCHWFA